MLLRIASTLMAAVGAVHGAPMPVPRVAGVDQSPTPRAEYGKCTHAMQPQYMRSSHWCRFNRLGSFPEYPNTLAQKAFKFGRQTMYRGSIYAQKAACNVDMVGSDTHASVAVSTQYLKDFQGGWAADKGACGKCMCIGILGGDDQYNKGLQKQAVNAHRLYCFMGKVTDRCAECSNASIDILQDRPYAYAPNTKNDNPRAHLVNRLAGKRIFTNSTGPYNPEAVGTWTVLWNFVPCSWSHEQCAQLVGSYGYKTRAPKTTPGRSY